MTFHQKPLLTQARRRGILSAAVAVFSLLMVSAAAAQEPSPFSNSPSAAAGSSSARRRATMTLTHALERIGNKTGIVAVADYTVAFERVAPVVGGEAPASANQIPSLEEAQTLVEPQLAALVATLPPGTTWAKLFLPAPPSGRLWRGDEVAAFAYAQMRLFGNVGASPSDGGIEILGKRVEKDKAPLFVAGLGLKPVYLISNPKNRAGMAAFGAEPWSPLSRDQWTNLSKEDRKQYGEQQAARIMALSPEQRDTLLQQIRQHDKYFDSVKDPLEKMLGHGL